ncbi:unnamed protein product [Soboliphyme baturini]|uniref:Transposase n=1 Tax=Soboliphyme baturini TaxID=241478 RepID=A0A183IDR3_9BILA|nr:unnamed protein product [Soboliphyme baturini]
MLSIERATLRFKDGFFPAMKGNLLIAEQRVEWLLHGCECRFQSLAGKCPGESEEVDERSTTSVNSGYNDEVEANMRAESDRLKEAKAE